MRADRARGLSWNIASETHPDAFETYHGSIADLYDVRDVATGGKVGFRSRTTAFLFGDCSLGRGRSVAQTMAREAGQVRRSGLDHVSIIINFAETRGDCDGRNVRAAPGSVQFRDLTRPSASRTETIDVINLMAPRATAPAWLLDSDIHGLVLGGSSAGGRLIASHLSTLTDMAAELTEAEGVVAIEAAFLMAERFLGGANEMSPAHAAAAHRTVRQRAGDLLERSLPDSALDIDGVARAIGVSRSTLYRAFEPLGGVRAYVQRRRLDRAHAALRRRRGRWPSVGEIAGAHGFLSDAHFSRAFRQRFGFPPGELGPSPLGLNPISSGAASARAPLAAARHDVLLDWMRGGPRV